jgi:perosamine synthetase
MRKFRVYNTIDKEEILAVSKVMKTGVLSKYLASSGKYFNGGPQVLKFEDAIKKYFKVKYALTLNSWTSGLIASVGALDVSPGDEIIVTTWSMCASATAIVHWNCIPVFADIDPETYNIDPKSIEKKITKKTKAIMTVDIFGQSCDIKSILKIAKKNNLKVISDSAQSIGSKVGNKFAGTLSDIGGYSLNYHKHINTGEGGIIVTNNKKLFRRASLIRNHAEAVLKKGNRKDFSNMVGFNFRLGEIEAAIGIQQLKKLNKLIIYRQKMVQILNEGLKDLKYLKIPKNFKNNTHIYYLYPLTLDTIKAKISRKIIVKRLKQLGVPGLIEGYEIIHKLPMFKKKIAYGTKNFPWILNQKKNKIFSKKTKLNVAENLHKKDFFAIELCLYNFTKNDMNFIVKCFKKVWKDLKLGTKN